MNAAFDESGMIEKFLGPDRASGSPFDLLGVPPRDVTPAEVVGALEARLAEIDRHPEARTPSADEVRLALHATAAQLMDAVVRGVLIREWGPVSRGAWEPSAAAPPAALAADPNAASAGARLALEGDAILAMAMEGGWNERSLHRLCIFAHARGLTATDVARAVDRLARPAGDLPAVAAPRPVAPPRPLPRPAAPMAPAPAMPAEGPRTLGPGAQRGPAGPEPLARPRTFELTEEEVRRQTAVRLKVLAGVVGCGTIVLCAAATGVIIALRGLGGTPAAPPAPAPAPTPGDRPGPRAGADPKATPAPRRPGDVSTDITAADAVRRQIAAATARLRESTPDAVDQFAAALRNASSSWVRWSADERAAVQDAVIEYLYKAERDSAVLRAAAESLGSPARASSSGRPAPAGVLPALWSAGILSRVVRERDLPASVSGPARLALAGLLGSDADLGDGTFLAGVSRAVVALSPRLAAAPDPEAWRRWLEGVAAVSADPATRGQLLASALDTILSTSPDPLSRPATVESIGVLATALSWRADEQTRSWVFRWFDSADVTTPALHALTAAIASRSGAEGITPAMVLSAAASPGERADLRAKYAAAWTDAPGGARSEVAVKWREAAENALSGGVDATVDRVGNPVGAGGEARPHVQALLGAVTFSRLSEAAAWIRVGDSEKAGRITGDVSGPLRTALPAYNVLVDPLGGDNDGAWAVRYLHPGTSAATRVEMLKQAVSAEALTALECEVVASEAVRGTPASVREAARKAVARHRGLPAMLNAVLNLAPVLPPVAESASLIEELTGQKPPPLRDARWREAVRRSLVERLLELAAGKGEYGAIDLLAAMMGTSYRERLAALGGAEGLPSEVDGATLLRLAEAYRQRWDKEAERTPPSGKEPATLGQIRQRAAGRAGVAANIVQRFVAEEAALVELMAYVVVAEDPARAEAVASVMAEWEKSRRAAEHIFQQSTASERAMLELWRVRTKGATP